MPGNDDDIWSAYAKTVKPVAHAKPRIKKPVPKLAKSKPAAKTPPLPKPTTKPDFSHTFDKKAERDLRAGDITIDARIDLHGMTQTEAYAALDKFLTAQSEAGRRNLLVITGKGKQGEGVIRTNLPQWLESLTTKTHILSLRPAAIKHGGSGAFYVILRRPR